MASGVKDLGLPVSLNPHKTMVSDRIEKSRLNFAQIFNEFRLSNSLGASHRPGVVSQDLGMLTLRVTTVAMTNVIDWIKYSNSVDMGGFCVDQS
jgi:hypothetical protein